MKTCSFIVVLLVAGLFGCQKEPSMQNEQMQAELKTALTPLFNYHDNAVSPFDNPHLKGKAVERPMKVKSSGTISFNPFSDECPPYGPVRVTIQGAGTATHLGNFSVAIAFCSDGTSPVEAIIATTTAANGDQMIAQLIGSGPAPEYGPNGSYQTYLIIGGTGRFDGATGHYTLYGVVDYANGVFSHAGEGVITF